MGYDLTKAPKPRAASLAERVESLSKRNSKLQRENVEQRARIAAETKRADDAEADRDKWRSGAAYMEKDRDRARRASRFAHDALDEDGAGYWAWEHGEDNHLETLTCAVLIRPDELAEIVARAQDAEADAAALRAALEADEALFARIGSEPELSIIQQLAERGGSDARETLAIQTGKALLERMAELERLLRECDAMLMRQTKNVWMSGDEIHKRNRLHKEIDAALEAR